MTPKQITPKTLITSILIALLLGTAIAYPIYVWAGTPPSKQGANEWGIVCQNLNFTSDLWHGTQNMTERLYGNYQNTPITTSKLTADEYWLTSTNITDILAYPEQPASYIIFGRDTDGDGIADIIYAKNGTTGKIDYQGTDAAIVVKNVLNSLPSERTNKVRVVLKGVFEITSQISLPDYLILDLSQAKLNIAYFHDNAIVANSKKYVEI